MIVKMSPFARLILPTVDCDLALKCVGITDNNGYIISNNQLKIVGIAPCPDNVLRPRDTDGRVWKKHTAIKWLFITEIR